MKTILVTGGAGFIGSHVCKALGRAGYLPVTLDNLERGHAWAVKWGPLEQGDLRDERILERVFEEWRPEAVVHLAAYAYVGESTAKPLDYYRNNIGGTANLLKACVGFSCKRVVFSSSCAVYGVPARLPLTETHPQQPINPYGYTKLVVEQMLRDAEAGYGIRHVVLRYFNAAGADPSGELGEVHEPETHLIPLVLLAAMGRYDSVKIFGDDYPTADRTCIRDYVHVNDLADAHLMALEWLAAGRGSECFNLGSGQGVSVGEVIRTSERITDKRITTEICPRRTGDPPVLISDTTKATYLLGWKPQIPDVEQQIAHAWRWFSGGHRPQ
jgi:UDP-arabinose 4-epimerase